MSPYQFQWNRIMALFKTGRIPLEDYKQFTQRHAHWFDGDLDLRPTPLLINDARVFADHWEQFGKETALNG